MNSCPIGVRRAICLLRAVACCLAFSVLSAGRVAFAQTVATPSEAVVLNAQGTVELLAAGAGNWTVVAAGQTLRVGDRLRTGPRSRATLKLSDLSVLRVSELWTFQLQPPYQAGGKAVIDIKAGSAYFFSRDRPDEIQLRTPVASGAIRGTEFNVAVAPDGRTELTLLDGSVSLSNPQGSVTLTNGQEGVVEAGRAPVKTAALNARNVIQWTLYYPAVLDPAELGLAPVEQLTESVAAYRAGDLPKALHAYPAGRAPATDAERVFHAELLLSVGLVEQAESELGALTSATDNTARLAGALRELLAAVRHASWEGHPAPQLASQWLAESYYFQSRAQLPAALTSARKAVEKSPSFAFAWERVAELEFSFGRTGAAIEALNKSLALADRNAQALAVKGFLLSAQNRIRDAITWFDQAIALDGALANAWLGRGLCRIRLGQPAQGRADLLVAAAVEPQRSVLRSYLGKAFGDAADDTRANKELRLARQLDPNDPTSWLYSALLDQQENRINDAIEDLQSSQQRNDNRSLFRSSLLLDQDRGVGNVNLATLYRDAGMTDVSVREAARAVTYDYANASAHLFLSDAYNDLRDPTQFNLRYETVWESELLLANALAPVGAGRLSQEVSPQEYSKLFQSDGLGLATSTDGRSDGMFHEQTSQFATFGDTAYALDLDYRHNDGVRVNNVLDDIEWHTTIKEQITPRDTALLIIEYQSIHDGDDFQYYNQYTQAQPNYKFEEDQQPILLGLWHHEWGPGMHTLILAGRLIDHQHITDSPPPNGPEGFFESGGILSTPASVGFNIDYQSSFTIYSAEVNQICQWDKVTLSLGTRYQSGSFQTQDQFTDPSAVSFLFNKPIAAINYADSGFERISGYGYATVQPLDRLWLTAGLAYDQVHYPENFRNPPISSTDDTRAQLGPKAAAVWSPLDAVTLRGAYTRSLGGVSLDESYRLEPTQLAGFPQAFRSLISESIASSVTAPVYETAGLALDLKLGPRTYAGIEVDRLTTDIHRDQGFLAVINSLPPAQSYQTPERLDYAERDLSVSLNQLLGSGFVAGAGYKLTDSDYHDKFPDVSPSAGLGANDHSLLQEVSGYVLLNHSSGFFAEAQGQWFSQYNSGSISSEPGESIYQVNLYAGYRFARRRAEVMLGLLNLTGQNYYLSPLTPYQEMARKQVVEGRLNIQF